MSGWVSAIGSDRPFFARFDIRDDFHIGLIRGCRYESHAHDHMVVGDRGCGFFHVDWFLPLVSSGNGVGKGTQTWMVVPLPGELLTSNSALMDRARAYRIPAPDRNDPRTSDFITGSKPAPSSAIVRTTARTCDCSVTSISLAWACFTALVIASWAMRRRWCGTEASSEIQIARGTTTFISIQAGMDEAGQFSEGVTQVGVLQQG